MEWKDGGRMNYIRRVIGEAPFRRVVIGRVEGWPDGWWRTTKVRDEPSPHDHDAHRKVAREWLGIGGQMMCHPHGLFHCKGCE